MDGLNFRKKLKEKRKQKKMMNFLTDIKAKLKENTSV